MSVGMATTPPPLMRRTAWATASRPAGRQRTFNAPPVRFGALLSCLASAPGLPDRCAAEERLKYRPVAAVAEMSSEDGETEGMDDLDDDGWEEESEDDS